MKTPATLMEPSQTLPIFGDYDVVVVGGGPAGLAASVSASKHGKKVLLVERYGFLGGMGTAGGVTNFAGLYGRKSGEIVQLVHGVVDDLLARLDLLGGLNDPQDGMNGCIRVRSYDVSAYKCAADQWLLAAGVKILFHAYAVNVIMNLQQITAIVLETKSGRCAVRAKHFIDCSGDADVAKFAGVPYELGDGYGSGLFPSLMFRVGGVDPDSAMQAIGPFHAINEWIERVKKEQPGRYKFAREGAILRPQKDPREWRVNVTQISNLHGMAMDATDASQLSAGELEGRRQIADFFEFLKNEIPGFENARIVDIAPQVGIRESRRINGHYKLSGQDILESVVFEDSIGLNTWPMEVHTNGRIEWNFPYNLERGVGRTYNDLPWRMLVPLKADNLLVAGRCASMTHEGQSAARVSGACFVMGQAAGTAAALIGQEKVFSQINIKQLQDCLIMDGAILN